MNKEFFPPDKIVKTCRKLESGMFIGIDGLRPCVRGVHLPPIFLTKEEILQGKATKALIVERRKNLVRTLNDPDSEMACKHCLMVEKKPYGDIDFSRLGHLDLQHYTLCNLRCTYCAYTRQDIHLPPQYDALSILRQFSAEEIEWNAHVDFAGGEPTLLDNMEAYLEFFRSRRIRVLMHTNSVRFNRAIYDGLRNGSIYWTITSLDCGTPSTFTKLRGGNQYLQVLENLCRYASAGTQGKGMLAVKYILCGTNHAEDDLAGFAYAMLAIRPQKVWLTLDFTPLSWQQWDYDYTPQINAYAKLYWLLKKHGIEVFHYFQEAIAAFSLPGREIMDRIFTAIDRQQVSTSSGISELVLGDFRKTEPPVLRSTERFSIDPLRLLLPNGESKNWCLEGKRVLLVPACPRTQTLLSDKEVQRSGWIGFIDRNPIHHGKKIEGRMIYSYEEIGSLQADAILVGSPEKHRLDILEEICRNAPDSVPIAELV